MSASDFPLSKRRKVRSDWDSLSVASVVRGVGHTFRLLLAFSMAKEQYRATLVLENERDLSVLA